MRPLDIVDTGYALHELSGCAFRWLIAINPIAAVLARDAVNTPACLS